MDVEKIYKTILLMKFLDVYDKKITILALYVHQSILFSNILNYAKITTATNITKRIRESKKFDNDFFQESINNYIYIISICLKYLREKDLIILNDDNNISLSENGKKIIRTYNRKIELYNKDFIYKEYKFTEQYTKRIKHYELSNFLERLGIYKI